MKRILSLLMALLMLFGTISFAENTETDPLETILSGMTLRDKVAQMMIASFRVWKEVPPEGAEQPAEEPPKVNITELNEEIREMVSRNHFGGILLFGENISNAEQTLGLISDFQTTNQAGGGLPQIFFTHQEGGSISRISYGTQGIGNMALGATGDPENARTTAAAFGEEYRPAAKHSEGDDEVIRSQIERAVVSYAANGTRDEEALSALASLNPSLGEKWMRIMDLWETSVTVNEALPDGLPDDDSLCLVGLGFQLNPDGTMREELVERLKVMLAASEKYPNAVIVCTGGGTAADDQTATEAGRMAEWLEAHGVNPSRLIVEDHSLTTAQNAIYTFNILSEQYPQVKQIALISSDYHIATGTLLFGAEAILRGSAIEVVSNASWHAPGGTLSAMFQAGALIELSGDVETAFEIYYETYDIHELPPLHQETAAES